jgi:hypothetical protein
MPAAFIETSIAADEYSTALAARLSGTAAQHLYLHKYHWELVMNNTLSLSTLRAISAATAVAAILALAAGAASAQTVQPGLTRAEVQAELSRAIANGEVPVTDADYPKWPAMAPSTVTRAQVQAEYLRARANGEIPYTDADYPKMPVSAAKSTVTREQVLAELREAQKNGEVLSNEIDFDVANMRPWRKVAQ